ncbi:HD family phosphohydrolase [Marinifilum caeruleilacunae]|uniref:HDIG domain-containing protein n=1 Tax=Marinifilum caeruleilacunae TaxID=2499076 RepID=A0ABX1X019_9BACT|nr:HDIG domain-containing metalloprotein [Marinifilum caeruleilacunae]NOU61737.1 HDIG domain-containing protein [Marinifilum caeruleilacunae]
MNKYFRFIRQNLSNIYRFSITSITIVLIMLLFPNTGNFKYEYQKGKPWMHETLLAPFEFPILKTEKELNQDRDSILNRFSPYFKVDTSVYPSAIARFEKNFEKKWNQFEKSKAFQKLNFSQKRIEAEKLLCYNYLKTNLKNYYEIGIADFQNEKIQFNYTLPETINKSVNNINEQVATNKVFSARTAYENINGNVKSDFKNPVFQAFIQGLNLDSYLAQNLFYDKTMSDQVRNSMLENISLTKGKVERGKRIVLVGDIINDETFLILESLKKEHENLIGSSQSHYLIVGGQTLLIISCIVLLFLYLRNFRRQILHDNKKILFIFLLVLIFVALTSLIQQFPKIHIYLLPFALITIVVRTLMDSRTALFVFIITVLITGFLAPNAFEFVFLQLAAGIMAIYSLPRLERRGQLVLTGIITFFTYSVIYFAFAITQEGSIEEIKWFNFMWFAINGLLLTFSYSLIYIFEKLFGFLSDVTLIELSNQNHPLLRQLIQHSPGTFQHSLQVANLAEAAINKIGGNPLLVRTGALYHDIGKMKHPVYFIENQMTNKNPHDDLDFDKSAQIITDHVKYGVKIAKKHKLPQQIIDFIETHHGAGKVMYFYTSFKNKYPDREVDEEKFKYPGPDPFTKETAVLMMADGIEAASRSLKEKTPETIRELIDKMIDKQVNENRFANADITFKNINEIKEIFTNNLVNAYHARIEYPKENKSES